MQTASKSSRSTGRVTLSDVALAAGVSPITVSRALRGERSVAGDLVERVFQASRRLGYVPDPAARALASQRSNHIAILIPKLSNTLFVDLLDSAQQTLRAAGFQTLIGVTLPEEWKVRILATSDQRITRDGVIVIKAQESRSQDKNKAYAVERLQELIRAAIVVQKKRRPTKPTRSSQKKRVEGKVLRGRTKALRRSPVE